MSASNKPGPIEFLNELVSLPSVSSTSPQFDQGNRAVIDLLAERLESLGFNIEIQEINSDGSKANLIASLGAGPGGLVLAALNEGAIEATCRAAEKVCAVAKR